jgi:hypothetical protein
VVLPALGPSLSHLKSRARVLSGCAILDYFPPFISDLRREERSQVKLFALSSERDDSVKLLSC